jgi:hypothetical protein
MRWVLSVLIFCVGMAGAVYIYVWDGHIAVPSAVAAITLVFSCMALVVGGSDGKAGPAPERRFNQQPEASWPRRDETPDSRNYRRG